MARRYTGEELAKISVNLRRDQMQWLQERMDKEGLSITNFLRIAVDEAIRKRAGILGGEYGTESFAVSTPSAN